MNPGQDEATALPSSAEAAADLLIGLPERESAREALETHFGAGRIDAEQYAQRLAARAAARTQAELREIFRDLPAPHPCLPTLPHVATTSGNDVADNVLVAAVIVLVLGLPVAIVVGIVYGAWWALALPIAGSALIIAAAPWLERRRR